MGLFKLIRSKIPPHSTSNSASDSTQTPEITALGAAHNPQTQAPEKSSTKSTPTPSASTTKKPWIPWMPKEPLSQPLPKSTTPDDPAKVAADEARREHVRAYIKGGGETRETARLATLGASFGGGDG